MPANDTSLFAVRLPEAERRRIKALAASRGLTLGQAIHEAFEAWASLLRSGARLPGTARRTRTGAEAGKPGQRKRVAAPADDAKLFAVRLPEAEKRRIKALSASQGLTLGQAIHEAFEAWAAMLRAPARTPGPAPTTPAATNLEKPRQSKRAAPASSGRGPGTDASSSQHRDADARRASQHRDAGASRASHSTGGEPLRALPAAIDLLLRAGQLDWSKCPAAESVPGKTGNVWVVRGTHAPLAAIFQGLAEGYPLTQILDDLDITLQQVMAILQFAAEGGMPAATGK